MIVCSFLIYAKRIKNKNTRGIFVRSKKQKNNFGFAFYNSTAVEDDSFLNGSNSLLKSMEFTEDRLELGVIIGHGAYGIVMKAEAIGIENSMKMTTVAVKVNYRSSFFKITSLSIFS